MSFLSKAQFLGRLNPKAWDFIVPQGPPLVNDFLIELFVADTVKEAAKSITDKSLQKKGIALSQKMAAKAATGLIAGWEPGDPICPPWWPRIPKKPKPRPWPWPNPWWDFHPVGPDPVLETVKGLTQIEVVSGLVTLSSLTMEKEFNKELLNIASSVAGGISSSLAQEVDRCGTVPRTPWGSGGPRPR